MKIAKTVKFFLHNGSIPQIAQNEEAIAATRDLIKAIKLEYDYQEIVNDNNGTITVLKNLTDIFLHKAEEKHKSQVKTQMTPKIAARTSSTTQPSSPLRVPSVYRILESPSGWKHCRITERNTEISEDRKRQDTLRHVQAQL